MSERLHRAQMTVLYELRHREDARFSDLRYPTNMDSDVFKFHIKKLMGIGYVQKNADGKYVLTAAGKEFANNLNAEHRAVQKQPKLSVLLVVARQRESEVEYLFQKRSRQPYFGYWGSIGGPVQWGEDFNEAASRELDKQAGLMATFEVRTFVRQRDYERGSGEMLEDKLFVVMEAVEVEGALTNIWPGGYNEWMTVNELETRGEPYFDLTYEAGGLVERGEMYLSRSSKYRSDVY